MTPPSSTSSSNDAQPATGGFFSTLRVSPKLSASILCAIVLLALMEVGARVGLAAGYFTPERGLAPLINHHADLLAKQKPAVWLLGNSTLEFGVDDTLLPQFTGGAVKLPHGSASLRASAAMLDLYLDHAPVKPTKIVLLTTKDDLNLNGYRFDVSKKLVEIGESGSIPWDDFLAIRKVRSSLKAKFTQPVDQLDKRLHSRNKPAAGAINEPGANPDVDFPGKVDPKDVSFLEGLLKDFKVDDDGFAKLAAVAKKHNLPAPTVILLPVTDTYVAFHNKRVTDPTYQQIREQVAGLCTKNAIPLIDLGDPSNNHANFRDSYHLNSKGAKDFTAKLIEFVNKK